MSPIETFIQSLAGADARARIQASLIGDNAAIDGPFGRKRLIYADYVASGRALALVEDFIRDQVLPYYANTHTQASFCGSYMTRLREAARGEIARLVGADDETSVIFSGSGSTAGINRLAKLLDIAESVAAGKRAVVLIGPYEHHSNILPWRESGAEIIEIAEGPDGGPDLGQLEAALSASQSADILVGAFCAASNVTGILTDVDTVTRLLRRHGAISIWDYGAAAPYVTMNMKPGTDAEKDAIVFSPHKFPGGPGASGALIMKNAIARRATPSIPGGGTVSFVSPWGHVYSGRLSAREEGGTPNVIGDIRTALAMLVKEALGQDWLDQRHQELRKMALDVWTQNERLELLGMASAPSLPIFSFRIRDGEGGYVHHQLFTRLLSDVYGIQARGGCACAGPYAHRLLDIDEARSSAIMEAIALGDELEKPGWVRLNLSALLDDAKAETIVKAVDELAGTATELARTYHGNAETAQFKYREPAAAAFP